MTLNIDIAEILSGIAIFLITFLFERIWKLDSKVSKIEEDIKWIIKLIEQIQNQILDNDVKNGEKT